MEQLLLKMDDKSDVKVIAASAYNFRIELVKKVGKDDIPKLIDISHCMAERFGKQALRRARREETARAGLSIQIKHGDSGD